MGVAELVAAFNEVTGAAATCTKATLGYSREHDVEWQVLTFYGTRSNGMGFAVEEKLPPGADPVQGAKAAAQKLLDAKEPSP